MQFQALFYVFLLFYMRVSNAAETYLSWTSVYEIYG